MSGITLSVIIATRNRADALALSLPLLLQQSVRPQYIRVIDSSDNPQANRDLVQRLSRTSTVPLDHQTSPAGSALQRNVGLAQITSDVVVFPDDDSLLYPDALAQIMRVYDRDTRGLIGGVGALEARISPLVTRSAQDVGGKMSRRRSIKAQIAPARAKLENRLFPDPMKLVARRLQEQLQAPESWLSEANAMPVEWITGFRMSFRSDVIRRVGFNENLGRYALYEDIDAGLGVLAAGYHLVVTGNALIYHDRAPGNRTGGQQMGVINILNRAYVTLRSGMADASVKAAILRQARFRTAQFGTDIMTAYGRDRFRGAMAACSVLPELLAAAPSDWDRCYLRLRTACLPQTA